MIISHKHKYLFIEVPRTGTTTISEVLCSHYDGERILRKHSSLLNFRAHTSNRFKDYFIFSSMRNPMDRVLSLYFKLRNGQKNPLTKSSSYGIQMGDLLFRRHYNFIQKKNVTFSDYFLKFYRWPYNDTTGTHENIDFIIRFEYLEADFNKALTLLRINKRIDLPTLNPTKGRRRNFLEYYNQRTWERAVKVFGPFFKKWGYKFPREWSPYEFSYFDQLKWNSSKVFLKSALYLLYLGED